MYERFTIKRVILTMSKLSDPNETGENYVVINGITDGGVYVDGWIGETAPEVFIERWWRSAGLPHHGWESYFSASGFDLIGKEVLVKLKKGKFKDKMDIDEVRSLDYVEKTQEKPAKIDTNKPIKPVPDDDIPF